MIERAISEIFDRGSKMVIIPGFGAFIKRESGELVFTDMLCVDDGILVSTIKTRAGISEEQARITTGNYVLAMRDKLRFNNRATVEGLGVLSKNSDGTYKFEATPSHVLATNSVPHAAQAPSHPIEQSTTHTEQQQEAHTAPVITPEQNDCLDNSTTCKCEVTEEPHVVAPPTAQENVYAPSLETTESKTVERNDSTAVEVNSNSNHITPPAQPISSAGNAFPLQGNTNKEKLRSFLYGEDEPDELDIPDTGVRAVTESEQKSGVENKEQTTTAIENLSAAEPPKRVDRPRKSETESFAGATENTGDTERLGNAEKISNTRNTPLSSDTVANSIVTEAEKPEEFHPEIHIRRPRKTKRRADMVIILAIVALVLVLGIMAYGYLTERSINELRNEELILEMQSMQEGDYK